MIEEGEEEEWKEEEGEERNTVECINSSLLICKFEEELIEDLKNNQRLSAYLIFRGDGFEGKSDAVVLTTDLSPNNKGKLSQGAIIVIIVCSIVVVIIIIVIIIIIVCIIKKRSSCRSDTYKNEKDNADNSYLSISKEKNINLEEMNNDTTNSNKGFENDNSC